MESHHPIIHSDKEDWYNVIKDIEDGLLQTLFDEYGNYRNRTVPTPVTVLPPVPNSDIDGLPTGTEHTPGIAAIPLTLMRTNIHINFHDCELRQVFQVSLNLMILTLCEADTSDEVVIATSRRPTLETTAATAHKSVEVSPKLNFEAMRPYFLHVDVDKVRKTFQRTTQFATNVMSGHRIIQTIQSPFLPTTSGVATNLLLPTLSSPKLLLFAPMAK
jgi:hypothetical protein